MDNMSLVMVSLLISVISALLALVTSKSRATSKVLGCLGGALSACVMAYAGFSACFSGASTFSISAPMPFIDFTLLLNPLAGLLLVVISVLAFVAWIYGLSYFDEYYEKGIGSIGFFMNLFVASMALVILVDNAFWFLVFFELMSLTSYMLVIVDGTEKSLKGGLLYLVMAHIGFLFIAIAYFLMASESGSLAFDSFRNTNFSGGIATAAFILAFFGFGAKAGVVPFHSWLPQAHPAAPSNVSALMSGGMIKIGIFGILKVALDLIGITSITTNLALLVIIVGAISSVLGVAYALREHDIKSLLAYHSVENIGIILLGAGTAFLGVATQNSWLAVIGLVACLYHLINHAMFKGLLFLGAGSVLHSTGTRNMEILGGLSKAMPVTAICFLIGSLAISAIPPLNGFVSEWFAYQGLISGAMTTDVVVKIVMVFAVVALAITGALAVTCFVKVYGVTFLGKPRSECAENAHEVPASMKIPMILLAAICICLGLGASFVTPVITNIADSILNISAESASGAGLVYVTGTNLLSAGTYSIVSPLLIAILLAIVIFICLVVRNIANSKNGLAKDEDSWECGYAFEKEMAPTASTIGANVADVMGPLYTLRQLINHAGWSLANFFDRTIGEKLRVACNLNATDASNAKEMSRFERDNFVGISASKRAYPPLSESVMSIITSIGYLFSRSEGGDFRKYILYIVLALIIGLVIVIFVK